MPDDEKPETDVFVCGFKVADDGHVYCNCCGDDLGAPDSWEDDDWPVTPGGFCWGCGLGCCPPNCPNNRSDDEYDPNHDALDLGLTADPCPECGAVGACGWDDEGRPLIHATSEAPDA